MKMGRLFEIVGSQGAGEIPHFSSALESLTGHPCFGTFGDDRSILHPLEKKSSFILDLTSLEWTSSRVDSAHRLRVSTAGSPCGKSSDRVIAPQKGGRVEGK